MSWKVYNVHTGKVIKAGFEDEDTAKDWLELRRDLATEDYLVEEMDEEEEDAWEDEEDDDDAAYVPDADDSEDEGDEFARHGMSYDDEDEDEDEDEDSDEDDEEEDEDDY